jgi:hypothetical protein
MALADRYGLQGGQPDWLADLIARYHLTPPSGPERPVIGGIGQRILTRPRSLRRCAGSRRPRLRSSPPG